MSIFENGQLIREMFQFCNRVFIVALFIHAFLPSLNGRFLQITPPVYALTGLNSLWYFRIFRFYSWRKEPPGKQNRDIPSHGISSITPNDFLSKQKPKSRADRARLRSRVACNRSDAKDFRAGTPITRPQDMAFPGSEFLLCEYPHVSSAAL